MAEIKINPWAHQPDETQEEYALFELYLRLRSVTEVAREYFAKNGATEGALVAGRSYCGRLKKEHKWDARTLAYDRWAVSIRDDATKIVYRQQAVELARMKISVVRKMVKHLNRVDAKMDALHAAEEHKLKIENSANNPDKIAETVHLGGFNMFVSAAKVVLGEVRELEKSSPLDAKVDTSKDQELNSALELLNNIIAKREIGESKNKGKDEGLLQ